MTEEEIKALEWIDEKIAEAKSLGIAYVDIYETIRKALETAKTVEKQMFKPYDYPVLAVTDVIDELHRAMKLHDPMYSPHEGYAVLLEEVEELKMHVWTKGKYRDIRSMYDEAKQVAAMALRFMIDVCNEEKGVR